METQTNTTIKDRLRAGGYEAACTELKREPLSLEKFKILYHDEDESQAFFSLHKVTTMIKALKEGRKLDYNNRKQKKYSAWWDMETYGDNPPGSGFRLHDVLCTAASTNAGARLSSESEDDTRFVAELLPEDYKNWMKEEIVHS